MTPRHPRARFTLFALICVLVALPVMGARRVPLPSVLPLMLPRAPDVVFGDANREVLVTCTAIFKVSLIKSVKATGVPVLGNTVDLDASLVKLFAQVPTLSPSLFSTSCDSFQAGLPDGGFLWQIVARPPGSTAQLQDAGTLTPRLTLDEPGEFTVLFTACEDEVCQLQLNNSALVARPDSATVIINSQTNVAIPPEIRPEVPDMTPAPPTRFNSDGLCGRWPDYTAPAWQTAGPWNGAGDYKLLEGEVTKSHSSANDNAINHHELDWNLFVTPDPASRDLLPVGISAQAGLEVEWERPSLHPAVRPTRGDRASVVGYWINDCAHRGRTEIHPPVMLATHRPRPLLLPASAGMGTNVWIAGIQSTVWVKRFGGETTGNCSRTGLHEARSESNGCLPETKGFDLDEGNPIDRIFRYHILLPRNPGAVLRDLGQDVPDADVYFDLSRPFGVPGPDPTIEFTSVGGVPALSVEFDLRGYTGSFYGRRIEAGWLYPSPDNWGLRRWRVRLDSVEVHDDLDADIDLLFGDIDNDGDWRMWLNLPNADREWTPVFDDDCHGCVQEGIERFGGDPWETGDLSAPHTLGSDVVLFPGQRLFAHSSGYEDDPLMEPNPIGHTYVYLPQEPGRYRPRSTKDAYTLHLAVEAGPEIRPARLSFRGRRIYESYLIRPNASRPTLPGLEIRDLDFNLPDQLELPIGTPPFNVADSSRFGTDQSETLSLMGISAADFETRLAEAREFEPEALEAAFVELREEVDRILIEARDPDVYNTMRLVESGLPADLWERHFGDIDVEGLGPPRDIRVPWWWLLIVLVGMLVALLGRGAQHRSAQRAEPPPGENLPQM